MSIFIGLGKSKSLDVNTAAKEAVETAMKNLSGNKPNMVFLYATFGYNFKELVKSVKEASGGAFVVGGSMFGVIDRNEGGDTQFHRVLICAIYSDDFFLTPIIANSLSLSSKEAGIVLKNKISTSNISDIKGLYLISDGLHIADPDSLLREVEAVMPAKTPIFGGSASEPLLWKNTYQFFDDSVYEDSIVGVVFSGKIHISVASSHGSQELGGTHIVTKSKGAVVYEIDNKPAMELFSEIYGKEQPEVGALTATGVCLGTKMKSEIGGEERIELRVPLSSNTDGSIVMPAAWNEGETIYICQRDLELIPKRNTEALVKVLNENNNKMPFLIFEANCLGRSADQIGADAARKEIQSAFDVFSNDVIWFGGYMHGEFASIEGVGAFHNWTGSYACIYSD